MAGATIAAIKPTPALTAAALRHWQAMRGPGDIQFAPVPLPKPQPPPDWLVALGRFLKWLFSPLAELFGAGWAVVKWGLIALAAALLLWLLWQLARLLHARLAKPRAVSAAAEPEWAPARAEAEALLADADALAEAGHYDEAAHLLLRRSVSQMAAARPHWVAPASTTRELATLTQLPERARATFAEIAARVEASRFALRPLALDDWRAARAAYADFALQRLAA